MFELLKLQVKTFNPVFNISTLLALNPNLLGALLFSLPNALVTQSQILDTARFPIDLVARFINF